MKQPRSCTAARAALAGCGLVAALLSASDQARADEGGASVWVPGFFGSLAATPVAPGWSLATIYYNDNISASGATAVSRQITIGRFNPTIDVSVAAQLTARPDILLFVPTYTFATPVLGGQAQVAFVQGVGRMKVDLDAVIQASLGPFSVTRAEGIFDSRFGFSDSGVMGNLRWNHGVHNFMTYGFLSMPTGTYDPTRLANLGLGHWGVDVGGGYTYFDPSTGYEASGVLGFTYNFENPYTDYKNGIDMHFDWGASKFLTKELQIGLVGYAYQQISCDSGAGDRVGCFESRVFGIGPQVGYLFPIGTDLQGYVNLKGYKEFESENRPEGWNVWATFVVSQAAPTPPPTSRPPIRK